MNDTSHSNRLILSILAVIVGLFMITIAPFLIQTSLERVISALRIVSAAKKAVELEGEPTIRGLDTLATAYAASGKVTEAVKWGRQAVQLANTEEREEVSQRLALYERGQAYVQPLTGEKQMPADVIESKPNVRTASDSGSSRKAR